MPDSDGYYTQGEVDALLANALDNAKKTVERLRRQRARAQAELVIRTKAERVANRAYRNMRRKDRPRCPSGQGTGQCVKRAGHRFSHIDAYHCVWWTS